jgi:hypothetical protein
MGKPPFFIGEADAEVLDLNFRFLAGGLGKTPGGNSVSIFLAAVAITAHPFIFIKQRGAKLPPYAFVKSPFK